MTAGRLNYRKGLTITEVMICIVILLIVVIGATAYSYSSALNIRRAGIYSTASRVGLLLCEQWRGLQGSGNFDPTNIDFGSDLTVTSIDNEDLKPEDYTHLGTYQIVTNDNNFFATLSYEDINTDLRVLNVVMVWKQRDSGVEDIDETDTFFKLTNYTIKTEDDDDDDD